jgi:hypothetical protein
MVGKAGTRMSYHSSVALSLPAAARPCSTWQWLVVVSSAKQKQQLHHQQLTNGSIILKTFTFPEFLDLFKLIYSIRLILAKIS